MLRPSGALASVVLGWPGDRHVTTARRYLAPPAMRFRQGVGDRCDRAGCAPQAVGGRPRSKEVRELVADPALDPVASPRGGHSAHGASDVGSEQSLLEERGGAGAVGD